MFKVNIRSDISLAQLVAMRQNGFSVMKTPHVGNVYTNNLVVAATGIEMNFYDRTTGEKDVNFHPAHVILHGTAEQVSCGRKLITHARVESPSPRVPAFMSGRSLIDCHMEAMQTAMPQANCVVYTDYLRENRELVLTLLEIVTRNFPRVWEFKVTKEGERTPLEVTSWKELADIGIYGLTNDEQGALVPNVLNILLDGLVESQRTGLSQVYHLSGPDMVRYIGGKTQQLAEMYRVIRREITAPEELIFNLIPVANIRLAGDMRHRDTIDELVEAWLTLGKGNIDRAHRIQAAANPEERKAIIGLCAEEKTAAMMRLREAANNADVVFYDIKQANCFTQHDMVAGRQLYVHPWAIEAPVSEIDTMIGECLRQREFAVRGK